MKTLILVLTKGPHRFRFGPKNWHDWIVQCRKAVKLQRQLPEAVVYVPSAVQTRGYPSELEYYRNELAKQGLTESIQLISGRKALILEPLHYETIGQIERGYQFADVLSAKLVMVSTLFHFPRVAYLCRGKGVMHKVAWGMPNAIEAMTDCALAVLFPLLDALGLGKRFQRWAITHRESGKHI